MTGVAAEPVDESRPTPRAAPRRRRLATKLLLAFAAGIGALELGLRVLDVQVPIHKVWRWHPTLGWTQVPGAKFDYVSDGRQVHLELNTLGFRDTEHQRAKPAGSRRLVVVGDSFCEAAQVNLPETFQQVLRARLESAGGGPVEAINLGVGDWARHRSCWRCASSDSATRRISSSARSSR